MPEIGCNSVDLKLDLLLNIVQPKFFMPISIETITKSLDISANFNFIVKKK